MWCDLQASVLQGYRVSSGGLRRVKHGVERVPRGILRHYRNGWNGGRSLDPSAECRAGATNPRTERSVRYAVHAVRLVPTSLAYVPPGEPSVVSKTDLGVGRLSARGRHGRPHATWTTGAEDFHDWFWAFFILLVWVSLEHIPPRLDLCPHH
jgi:hypothetical protein